MSNKQINTNAKFSARKLLIGLLVFIGIYWYLFGIPCAVSAQEVSLSITPPITEITIQPGKSFSQVFTVKNDGIPVVVVPKVIPFVPLDSEGHVELIEDANSINFFSNWFSFDPSPISLGTTVSHDFKLVITPPPSGIDEKDYYFTFLIETENDNNLGIDGSASLARIGANVLINISKDGNPNKKASIIDFSAPKIIDSFSGLTYKVVIGNSGVSFFKPVGTITVNQVFGSTTTLGLAPLNILMGSSRKIPCLVGQALVSCSLPGNFLIGLYKANLSFTVDGSGGNIVKQTYTFAFPFSIILVIIVIFVIYRAFKKMKT